MFKKKDPYTFMKWVPLYESATAKNPIATLYCEYQVARYENVQVQGISSVSQSPVRQFLVQCTQQINAFNGVGLAMNATSTLLSFDNYPALITANMAVDGTNSPTFQLLDYSPQTVNTKIQSSGTSGDTSGTTSGTSSSATVGSSTAQTNSYGASVTVSEMPSVSANYEYSSTSTQEQSSTTGTEASSNSGKDSSNTAGMSIKDWGAYGAVDPTTVTPVWTFGQEYPWDVIECRQIDTNSTNPNNSAQAQLMVPPGMLARLYDTTTLYPPSHLSMFGVNFVMKAVWLVTLSDTSPDTIMIDHEINYYSASHNGPAVPPTPPAAPGVAVYLDQQPTSLVPESGNNALLSTLLNLPIMGLDPLSSRRGGAIIGFIPSKFVVQPQTPNNGVPFEIVSTTNTLLLNDTTSYPSPTDAAGFTATATGMTAVFSSDCAALQMTLYFKVTDTDVDYTLFMKHWKTEATGVMLQFVINGDTTNQITKYVDSLEAEGGDDNLLSLALRNQDYASIDYHDFLQLGLNSIQITLTPIGGQYVPNCGYQIRALSVEDK